MRSAKRFAQFNYNSGNPIPTANLAAWFRFNRNVTASQWDDASGNGRHLKQATAANQPAAQGDGSLLFDGVDNYMKTDAFTLNQPETVYFLGKQLTWANQETLFDGVAINGGRCLMNTATPTIALYAGAGPVADNNELALNTYGIVSVVFNGANSLLQINSGTPTTGNSGTGNLGGFTLGANGGNLTFAHIQVKEVIIYSVAHDEATRTQIINYLNTL